MPFSTCLHPSSKEHDDLKAEYRSSIRSKNAIKRTLLELMQEKSFEDITVTDIVERADINRGTFYAHFRNTRDVLMRINEEMLKELTASIEAYGADYIFINPRTIFQSISNSLIRDQNYYRLAFQIGGIPDYINEHKQELFDYFLSSNTGRFIEKQWGRQQFLCLLDFWCSGILALYYDSLAGRIPMTVAELPEFCTRMVTMLSSRELVERFFQAAPAFSDDAEAGTAAKSE